MLFIVKLKDREGRTTIGLIEEMKEKEARARVLKAANKIASKGICRVVNSKGKYWVESAVSLNLSGLTREGNKDYGVCILTRTKMKEVKIKKLLTIMDAIEETVLNTQNIRVEKLIFIRELTEQDKKVNPNKISKNIDIIIEKEGLSDIKNKYKLEDLKGRYNLQQLSAYYTFRELLEVYTLEELENDYDIDNELIGLSNQVSIKVFKGLLKDVGIEVLEKYYTGQEIVKVIDKDEIIGYYKTLPTLTELYSIGELSSYYSLEELLDYYDIEDIGVGQLIKSFDLGTVIGVVGNQLSEADKKKLRLYVKKNDLDYQLTNTELEILGIE